MLTCYLVFQTLVVSFREVLLWEILLEFTSTAAMLYMLYKTKVVYECVCVYVCVYICVCVYMCVHTLCVCVCMCVCPVLDICLLYTSDAADE